MEVEQEVDFLGIQEMKISKGERAGQVFYIVKVIFLYESFEFMVFDNPTLISKLMTLERYKPFIARFKITSHNGNWRVNLIEALNVN